MRPGLIPETKTGRTRGRRSRRQPAPPSGGKVAAILAWRSCTLVGKILLPLVLLVGIGAGLLYARLLQGPVAMNFLAQPIADAVNAELGDLKLEVNEAIIRLVGRNIEFRLKDVKVLDRDNAPVAVAPLASFEMSRKALFAGRLSPSRVVLIEPKLLLFYSPEGGLTLRFARHEGAPPRKAGGSVPLQAGSGQDAPSTGTGRRIQAEPAGNFGAFGRIDLARTVAGLAKSARGRDHASAYLDAVGLRNATLIVDHAGVQTAWLVPEADFKLAHYDQRSVLTGALRVASSKGAWRAAFSAEDSETAQTVKLKASVHNVFPETIAASAPALSSLSMFRLPVNAAANFTLSSRGEVLSGNVQLQLSEGRLAFPWDYGEPVAIQGGQINVAYQRGEKRFRIQPSVLRWSDSQLAFGGTLSLPDPGKEHEGWAFDFNSLGGTMSPVAGWRTQHTLTGWSAHGRFRFDDGIVTLDRAEMKVGGGSAVMSGRIFSSERPGYEFEGKLSAMPAQAVLLYWPTFLASKTRKFFATGIKGGQLSSGSFKTAFRPADARNGRGRVYSADLDLALKDARFVAPYGLPETVIPVARVKLDDTVFTFEMAKGVFTDGTRDGLEIPSLRLMMDNIYDPAIDGRLSLQLAGKLQDVFALADRGVLGVKPVAADLRKKLAANVDARLDVVLPITRPEGERSPPPKVTGQVRILEGHGKSIAAGHDVTDASVLVDLGERVANVRGKLLVSGVPVAVGWQYINGAEADKQPPIKLTATLDEADRAALGMAVNHIIQGEVGLEVTFAPDAVLSSGDSHVRADLTRADVAVESLAWRKSSGGKAALEFDVVMKDGVPSALNNIRMVADGAALQGTAELGKGGRITSFDLPEFTINHVSQLKVRGVRRKNDAWRVSVVGDRYEGRDFFRALFSAGQLREKPPDVEEPSLDLEARVSNVLGFWNTGMKDVTLNLTKRRGKIVTLSASGVLKSGKRLDVRVDPVRRGRPRQLIAVSDDAGSAFELVGFYPNLRGGHMRLVVNLDGDGRAEKTGLLEVRKFDILGDPVINEFVTVSEAGTQRRKRGSDSVARQRIAFDWLRAPFSVGYGQFVLNEAELRGPLLGAVLRGKANFEERRISLGGTYVPLQGLNSALGAIPGLGQLLAGPKGEGILGMTFAVQGPMANPEFFIHPLSVVAPGIFREMFQLTNPTPRVDPGEGQRKPAKPAVPSDGWRSRMLQNGGGG